MAETSQHTGSDHGILAIWHDCAPGREAEFEAWYQQEHLIERLAVPGFLFGRLQCLLQCSNMILP